MDSEENAWSILAKNLPEIIAAAADKPLGIVALVILALAVIAIVFFWNDRPAIKLCVFASLVTAFGGLGLVAVYREAQREAIRQLEAQGPVILKTESGSAERVFNELKEEWHATGKYSNR